MLREQTGVDGFAALYRVLGLPERKLATASEIKKAYHKKDMTATMHDIFTQMVNTCFLDKR